MPQSFPSTSAPIRTTRITTLALGALFGAAASGCTAATSRMVPLAASAGSAVPVEQTSRAAVDWSAVDAAMGRPGVVQPGEVQRYNFPRGDLTVVVQDARGDITLRPAFALGGWIAMHGVGEGNRVMAMGDLVVTEAELAAVMSRLQEGGVEQTAVHHHVMRESPRVLYMHVSAHGDAVKIAETMRAAVALTKAPAPAPTGPGPAPAIDIDTAGVSKALGHAGRANGGGVSGQCAAPRDDPRCRHAGPRIDGAWHGHELPADRRWGAPRSLATSSCSRVR